MTRAADGVATKRDQLAFARGEPLARRVLERIVALSSVSRNDLWQHTVNTMTALCNSLHFHQSGSSYGTRISTFERRVHPPLNDQRLL